MQALILKQRLIDYNLGFARSVLCLRAALYCCCLLLRDTLFVTAEQYTQVT